ncbi:hypothetical protein EGYY_08390 [Eggerthella sp. YY7918]|nr:hypothetical protein EGYY_08390 [Eggerthella sp. YY7918]
MTVMLGLLEVGWTDAVLSGGEQRKGSASSENTADAAGLQYGRAL